MGKKPGFLWESSLNQIRDNIYKSEMQEKRVRPPRQKTGFPERSGKKADFFPDGPDLLFIFFNKCVYFPVISAKAEWLWIVMDGFKIFHFHPIFYDFGIFILIQSFALAQGTKKA